jgi:GDPmannose 4,6-dehydratase
LNWEPSVTFEELVNLMVDADIKALEKQERGSGNGFD